MLGAEHPHADGKQRDELIAGPAASPASPVQRARLRRAVRVSGCSAPETRSWMGSSAANWSRAPAAIARLPGPVTRGSHGRSGFAGCSRPEHLLVDGQQRGELVAGRAAIPRLPGPVGEVGAGDQGVPVLGSIGVIPP